MLPFRFLPGRGGRRWRIGCFEKGHAHRADESQSCEAINRGTGYFSEHKSGVNLLGLGLIEEVRVGRVAFLLELLLRNKF